MAKRKVKIANFEVGDSCPLFLIAGPCVIESYQSLFQHAEEIKKISQEEDMRLIFKASYDKANRTSYNSYRGPGLEEGLKMLAEVKKKFNLCIISDVHCRKEISKAAEVLDIIQIPALLSRQTDLIKCAAETGKVINIKKGQFMSPYDVLKACEKAYAVGNYNILVTERGTFFGYNNLVNDFRTIPILQREGIVVVFDATHSVQQPSSLGDRSGGERQFVPFLARAAVAVGCDGLFLEVHERPHQALSDALNMIDFKQLRLIIKEAKRIRNALGKK